MNQDEIKDVEHLLLAGLITIIITLLIVVALNLNDIVTTVTETGLL